MKYVLTLAIGLAANQLAAEESVIKNDASLSNDYSDEVKADEMEADGNEGQRGKSFWLVGAQYGQQDSIYLDTDDEQGPMPMLAYFGENFFWKGFELGYQVNPMGSPTNVIFSIEAEQYDVDLSDSSNADMDLLGERDASVMATLAYEFGPADIRFSQDVSGEHDGFVIGLGVSHAYEFGHFEVELGANFEYLDSKLSNHLYGVSQSEANLTSSNISAYDASSTQIFGLSVALQYAVTPVAKLRFELGRNDYFGVDDSPIVEEDHTLGAQVGFTYMF